MKHTLLVLLLFGSVGWASKKTDQALADAKETVRQLRAERAKEAATKGSTAAAVDKLGTDSKKDAEDARRTAAQTAASTEEVRAKVETLNPVNYIPIWMAMIAAISSMFIAWANNRKVNQQAKVQSAKIEQVHRLVNSERTAEIQRLLISNKANAVLLEELMGLKSSSGKDVVYEAGMLVSTRVRIAELEMDLKNRAEQTRIGELELNREMST